VYKITQDGHSKKGRFCSLVSELSSQQFGVWWLKPFVLVLDAVAFQVIVADAVRRVTSSLAPLLIKPGRSVV
jgi:hypothetical protein